MDPISPLLLNLATTVTKLLAKRCFRGNLDIASIGEDLSGTGIEAIGDHLNRKSAERIFYRYGEKVAMSLRSRFDIEKRHPGALRLQKVLHAIQQTLDARLTATFFMSSALDPARIAAALSEHRPTLDALRPLEWALFDQVLDELVRCIVNVADKLPNFDAVQARLTLQQLDRLDKDVDDILRIVRRIERRGTADHKYGRFEKDYRQSIAINLNKMELFGADISTETRHHSLSAAYVSLYVEQLQTKEVQGDSKQPVESKPLSMPVELVLDSLHLDSGRLLIRGEAGSGKSTLLKWIAIRAADPLSSDDMLSAERWDDLLSDPTTSNVGVQGSLSVQPRKKTASSSRLYANDQHGYWRSRVPFLIRLRDCDKGNLPEPDLFPQMIARELGAPPKGWVTNLLEYGRGLLLFDGIDEVPIAARERIRNAIVSLLNTYPKNLYLLSTRPQAVPADWLRQEKFVEATINRLSEVDRRYFIY
jgi:hypothetical protein